MPGCGPADSEVIVKEYTALNIPSMAQIARIPKRYSAISTFSGCGGASLGLRLAGFKILYANEFVPSAAAVYEANMERGTFLDRRDVREVTPEQILKKIGMKPGQLDYFDSSPPCFPPGELVRTTEGFTSIEDVRCGDRVLTHRGRFRTVTNTMARLYTGELVVVNARGTRPIPSTPEHPYLVRRKLGVRRFAPPAWLAAKDIRRGDLAAIQTDRVARLPDYEGFVQNGGFHRVKRYFTNSWVVKTLPLDQKPFWYLIGRYLGDGWLYYADEPNARIWVPVRRVSTRAYSGPVYNISVAEDETYTVNGIAVHNCKMYSSAARFSRMGKRADEVVRYSDHVYQRVDDLFDNFIRLRDGIKPKVFVAENVPGLAQSISKGFFLDIFNKMRKGYRVQAAIIDPSFLGVPQRRRRLVFIGVRDDLGMDPVFPRPLGLDRVVGVRDIIPDAYRTNIGKNKWEDSRRPGPTMTVAAAKVDEMSSMSAGGFIKTDAGDVRKLTIPELIRYFGYPRDFKLEGIMVPDKRGKLKPAHYNQSFERLARSHVPLQVYYIASTIAERILDRVKSKRRAR
jgi:hypothetical protein